MTTVTVSIMRRTVAGARDGEVSTFEVEFSLGNLAGTQREDFFALVDTGATLTTLPGSLLDALGIERQYRQRFRLGDGVTIVEADVGDARIYLEGQDRICPVAFGGDREPALLGVLTLEICSLGVDPLAHRLIPVLAIRY